MMPTDAAAAAKGTIPPFRQRSFEEALWSSTLGIDPWKDGHQPDTATGMSMGGGLSPSKHGE